ncbi:uncharacterized protein LOC127121138 [Lathyrus oleraceus]|uniref:uncharacterized protein LOC127121138 n=1 Tax=Pisum sativum TaxID=3888 RepID=UPI001FC451BF|nr:uncharacterized protein LOC127121138 [Pisum sativum]
MHDHEKINLFSLHTFLSLGQTHHTQYPSQLFLISIIFTHWKLKLSMMLLIQSDIHYHRGTENRIAERPEVNFLEWCWFLLLLFFQEWRRPKSLEEYSPICLVSSVYKILSKILVGEIEASGG